MEDISQRSNVLNNLPSTPNNNSGESLGGEYNTTVDEESATPVTKNSSSTVQSLSSSAVWSPSSSIISITATTSQKFMPPIQTTGITENQEDNESVNANDDTSPESAPYESCDVNEYVNANDDMSIAAVTYESMDDGSIYSIPQQPKLRKFTNVSEYNEYENGWDNDGEIGPFFEAVMDEDDMDAP